MKEKKKIQQERATRPKLVLRKIQQNTQLSKKKLKRDQDKKDTNKQYKE